MFSRIAISVVLASALLLSAARLPAASCILSNAPSEKACTMTCCANQTCCETSHQRTGPPVQPLAKASSDQPNIPALSSTVAAAVFQQAATESLIFSGAECSAHSPPPLTLSAFASSDPKSLTPEVCPFTGHFTSSNPLPTDENI